MRGGRRVLPQPIDESRIDQARSIVDVVYDFGALNKSVDASLAYDDRYTDTITEALKATNYDANLKQSLVGQ